MVFGGEVFAQLLWVFFGEFGGGGFFFGLLPIGFLKIFREFFFYFWGGGMGPKGGVLPNFWVFVRGERGGILAPHSYFFNLFFFLLNFFFGRFFSFLNFFFLWGQNFSHHPMNFFIRFIPLSKKQKKGTNFEVSGGCCVVFGFFIFSFFFSLDNMIAFGDFPYFFYGIHLNFFYLDLVFLFCFLLGWFKKRGGILPTPPPPHPLFFFIEDLFFFFSNICFFSFPNVTGHFFLICKRGVLVFFAYKRYFFGGGLLGGKSGWAFMGN